MAKLRRRPGQRADIPWQAYLIRNRRTSFLTPCLLRLGLHSLPQQRKTDELIFVVSAGKEDRVAFVVVANLVNP